jgi:hypothetical protein
LILPNKIKSFVSFQPVSNRLAANDHYYSAAMFAFDFSNQGVCNLGRLASLLDASMLPCAADF